MPRRFRPLALGAALSLAAAPVAAQVIRFPARQRPTEWVSLSAGVFQIAGDVVQDDRQREQWTLETAAQFRATAEHERPGGTSFGLVASYARPPVRYTRLAADNRVLRSEPARETVTELAALFRVGGGVGFHQVIEVSLGARRYAGFSAPTDAGTTVTVDGKVDFTGSLGFGFGFPLGQRAAVTVVQDADFTFHPSADTAPSVGYDGGVHRSYVTRLGLRYGFGNRSRIR